MLEDNDRLPINKSQPLKPTDWILLGILILLLLFTLPFLWWIYRPLLWVIFRFIIPVGLFVFIGYFALRAFQLGETNGYSPSENKFTRNLHIVWIEFNSFVRRYFKRVALTAIVVTLLFVGSAVTYTHYSKNSVTQKQFSRISLALEKHANHYGSYPASLAELIGNDPLKREWYKDSWGNKVEYTKKEKGYTLRSSGADGISGNADDVIASN